MLFGDTDIEMGLVYIQLIIHVMTELIKNSPELLKAIQKKCSLQDTEVIQSAAKMFH